MFGIACGGYYKCLLCTLIFNNDSWLQHWSFHQNGLVNGNQVNGIPPPSTTSKTPSKLLKPQPAIIPQEPKVKNLQFILECFQRDCQKNYKLEKPGFLNIDDNTNLAQQNLEHLEAMPDRLHCFTILKSFFNEILESQFFSRSLFEKWQQSKFEDQKDEDLSGLLGIQMSNFNITKWRKFFINWRKTILPFIKYNGAILQQCLESLNVISFLLYDTDAKTPDKKFRMVVACFTFTSFVQYLTPKLNSSLYLHMLAKHFPEIYCDDASLSFEAMSCDRTEGWFAIAKKLMKGNSNRQSHNALQTVVCFYKNFNFW